MKLPLKGPPPKRPAPGPCRCSTKGWYKSRRTESGRPPGARPKSSKSVSSQSLLHTFLIHRLPLLLDFPHFLLGGVPFLIGDNIPKENNPRCWGVKYRLHGLHGEEGKERAETCEANSTAGLWLEKTKVKWYMAVIGLFGVSSGDRQRR